VGARRGCVAGIEVLGDRYGNPEYLPKVTEG
jgi:hypothetical protein